MGGYDKNPQEMLQYRRSLLREGLDGKYYKSFGEKAEGYRWNTTGWKALCRTCPAQGFSVQKFFEEALWISRADGIEVRFYDDFENEVGIYFVDKGQWM